jgi:hypothetical protein
MEAIALTVGIDVSKDRLDVYVRGREEGSGEERSGEERFDVPRDTEGISALAARLRALAPAAIGLEATGGLEAVVVASLAEAGLPVVVVNPAQVRAFANALGKRAKTDAIDAAVIAHFVEATAPEIRPLPDAETRLLADLVARRRQDRRHDGLRAPAPRVRAGAGAQEHRPPAEGARPRARQPRRRHGRGGAPRHPAGVGMMRHRKNPPQERLEGRLAGQATPSRRPGPASRPAPAPERHLRLPKNRLSSPHGGSAISFAEEALRGKSRHWTRD